MASELARELGRFPFTKLKPPSFRVEIAALTDRELEKLPLKVWIDTRDIAGVVRLAGTAHILAVYPHLDLVYLKTYGSGLAALVESDLVHCVWNDLPVKAEGCLVVAEAHPSARTLAARSHGRAH